jgi:predicted enzyme involved in methoxymalonyl-ACP biosynthesis
MDLWLMSCRVLKREMESAMMDEFVAEARRRGLKEIKGYYYPTAKNKMVKEFYGLQGFKLESEDSEGNSVWSLMIEDRPEALNRSIKVNPKEGELT